MAEATASRLSVLEKGLTVATASLALATGFLGYQSATISQSRDQAQDVANDTKTSLSSLQEEIRVLQAENAQLRGKLSVSVPTGAPGSIEGSPSLPPGVKIRHSGPLVLANGHLADLDSPASDPQWDDGEAEIGFYTSWSISIYYDHLYLGDKKADYKTCRNTTGYGKGDLNVGVGDYLCVRTDQSRYSAVHITALDSSKVELYVETYDPPEN